MPLSNLPVSATITLTAGDLQTLICDEVEKINRWWETELERRDILIDWDEDLIRHCTRTAPSNQ